MATNGKAVHRPKANKSKQPRGAAAERDVFDVDEAMTFQVAVLSNLIARPFYAQIGRSTGMTINDWRLLLVIASKSGMTQAEIAYATGFHKMTVSRSLRALTKYVELAAHPTDNRKHVADLTGEGWRKYNEALPVLRWRHALLMQALPPAKQRLFKEMLSKLIESARQWTDLPTETTPLESGVGRRPRFPARGNNTAA